MKFLKGLTRWFHFDQPEAQPQSVDSGRPGQPQQLVTRRNFLFGLGAVGVVAAMPEIPFGRVWSFPRIIRTGFADPGRIDMLNLAAWEKYPWDAQSVALQLEKVRHQLPSLFERDDALFELIGGQSVEPVSERPMRIPITDDEIHDTSQYLTGWEQRARRIKGDDGSHGPFNHRYVKGKLGERMPVQDRFRPGLIAPAGDDCISIPNLKTEAGKVSRLVDRYGKALAEKVDRTVVKAGPRRTAEHLRHGEQCLIGKVGC